MQIVESDQTLAVAVPLTSPTGKVRIKRRSCFSEYGAPVAAKQEPFTQLSYVEWQIGYDVVVEDNETAGFIISRANIDIFLNMLKIFGILSYTHNKDILAILEKIIASPVGQK